MYFSYGAQLVTNISMDTLARRVCVKQPFERYLISDVDETTISCHRLHCLILFDWNFDTSLYMTDLKISI